MITSNGSFRELHRQVLPYLYLGSFLQVTTELRGSTCFQMTVEQNRVCATALSYASVSLAGSERFNETQTHRETVCLVLALNEIKLPGANVWMY